MKQIRVLSFIIALALLAQTSILSAQTEDKSTPLPESLLFPGVLDTASDAIRHMYVSQDFATFSFHNNVSLFFNGQTIKPDHLNTTYITVLNELIDRTGRFSKLGFNNSQLEIGIVQYTPEDPKLIDAIERAVLAGIKVTVVADLNTALKGRFRANEKFHSDFQTRAEVEKSDLGKSIQRLFELPGKLKKAGLSKDLFKLVSQPLYNRKFSRLIPIMHEKALLIIAHGGEGLWARLMNTIKPFGYKPYWLQHANDEKVISFHSTGNLTQKPQRNLTFDRLYEVQDPLVALYSLAHFRAEVEAFDKKGEIKDIASLPPYKVIYKDGSFHEVAYTDGKYNLNLRIVHLLEQAAANPNNIKVKEMFVSHFVLSSDAFVEALRATMIAQPQMTGTGIFDSQFIDPAGFGVATALEGFQTKRNMQEKMDQLNEEWHDRLNFYVWQLRKAGVKPDGFEGKVLNHDKTTMFITEEDGKEWLHIFTGSFNLSDRFVNAERQDHMRIPLQDDFAQSMIHSIKGLPQKYKDVIVTLDEATSRTSVARLLRMSPIEIDLKDVAYIEKLVKNNLYETALKFIKTLWVEEKSKIDKAELNRRLTILSGFFKDYKAEAFDKLGRSNFTLNRMLHTFLDRILPNRYLMTRQQFSSALTEVTHKKTTAEKLSGRIGFESNDHLPCELKINF